MSKKSNVLVINILKAIDSQELKKAFTQKISELINQQEKSKTIHT